MSKFSNLHPSKEWAFVDGLLTGIFIAGTYFTYKFALKRDELQQENLSFFEENQELSRRLNTVLHDENPDHDETPASQ